MSRTRVELGWAITITWLALILAFVLAGAPTVALIVFLAPVLIGVISALALLVFWRRSPGHRSLGAWFNEKYHLRHW